MYFSLRFFKSTVLKYLQGMNKPIWDHWIKMYFSIITPRSLKVEDMWGEISAGFFVIWYRRRFFGSKFISFYIWLLSIWGCPDEDLVIYPIQTKYTFSLTTLDGSVSILIPKQSMNFLHSIILTFKMVSWFSLFR